MIVTFSTSQFSYQTEYSAINYVDYGPFISQGQAPPPPSGPTQVQFLHHDQRIGYFPGFD